MIQIQQCRHARRLRDTASCLMRRIAVVYLRNAADAVPEDGLLEAVVQIFKVWQSRFPVNSNW